MYIKTLASKVYPLQAKPKEMVRAQPTNNHTAGIGPNYSTEFTLLLELDVICEQNWVQLELQNIPGEFCIWWQNMHCHLGNLWNRITTKVFDIFRIITLKQQNFSQSDPVLIRSSQFSKKLQSRPVLILPKLASVLIQSDSVLICAHLW